MKVRWKSSAWHALRPARARAFASPNLPAKHHLVATQNLRVSDGRWTDRPSDLCFGAVGGWGGDLAPSLDFTSPSTLHPPP